MYSWEFFKLTSLYNKIILIRDYVIKCADLKFTFVLLTLNSNCSNYLNLDQLLFHNKSLQTWWHKTIYCARRLQSDIWKRHSMAVLSVLWCCGSNWEDSKPDSKCVLISGARSHLEDCPCVCLHLVWDLKMRAAHTWPFHVSWLPPSMAAPGGLVSYKTLSASVPEI